MVTGPIIYWLQRVLVPALIGVSILLLSLAPARHVLLPLWPTPIDEFIVLDEERDAVVRALSIAHDDLPDGLLARSRPSSVVAIEKVDGSMILGFPVGLRQQGGEQDPIDQPLLDAFRRPTLHAMPLGQGSLLVMGANEELSAVALSQIEHLVYPNRLNWLERVWFVAVRVRHALLDRPDESKAGDRHGDVTEKDQTAPVEQDSPA